MIRLNSISRKITFKTSVAVTTNELPIIVSYKDNNLGGTQITDSTGATAVSICDSPTAGNVKEVDFISIVNLDTTQKRVFVYYLDDSGLSFVIKSALLDVGDQLVYSSSGGWVTMDLSGSIKSINSEGGNVPKVTKVTKTYQNFSTAGLTNDIEIYSLDAGERLVGVTMSHTSNFTGGAIATYTLSVGINGNLTKYSAAMNVFSGAGAFQDTSNFYIESWSASTSVRAAAVSTVANLSAATSGSVDIFVETIQVKS